MCGVCIGRWWLQWTQRCAGCDTRRARCVVWWSIDDSGYLTRKERQASEVDCRSGMEEERQSWRRANVICGPALYTFQKNSCNFRLPRFRIGLSARIRLYSCLSCPHISLNFARSHASMVLDTCSFTRTRTFHYLRGP